jgi:DNA-directed RNA polymerase beta subunit
MTVYLSLEMNTLPVGTKVRKNQVIAGTKNFDINNNMYCSGRNVFMAVMQYMGFGHEDSYVIGSDMSNAMTRDIVKELQIVIPPDTKVLKLETETGKQIHNKETLVEFSYEDELEDYINLNQLEELSDDEELLSTFIKDKDTIKLLGIEGEIIDIKVFINNKNAADPQITSFHRKITKETNNMVKKLSEGATNEGEKLKAIDNMSLKFTKIGGHKLKGGRIEFMGSRIVYYIKQKKELTEGDKLATRYGKQNAIISGNRYIIKSY